MLKKVIHFTSIIFSLFTVILSFNSCKNTTESKLVYTENNTIKQNVKQKEQEITWTNELEGERLLQVINRGAMKLGQDVTYNKELYKIDPAVQQAVYPSLEDFGSLDTQNLRPAVKNKLNAFCKAFASEKHNGAESYFSRKYIFNYVFFVNDFEAGWQKNFNKKIPSETELFTKWIFGEPFIGSDIMQIPVRFYTDCGTIDVTVFLTSQGNNEFYQICIDRWQKV